jgi:alpha-mannosidase
VDVPFKKAQKTNLMEEKPTVLTTQNGEIELIYRPFEIITLVLE